MANAPKKTATAGPADKAIKVVCATEGFRRGGHAFGREAKVIALSDLTPVQLEQITGEPRLAVVEIELPAQ